MLRLPILASCVVYFLLAISATRPHSLLAFQEVIRVADGPTLSTALDQLRADELREIRSRSLSIFCRLKSLSGRPFAWMSV